MRAWDFHPVLFPDIVVVWLVFSMLSSVLSALVSEDPRAL